jgi:hypothetical protein
MQNTGFLLQKFTFGRSDFGRYQSWGQLGVDRTWETKGACYPTNLK